MIKKIRQKVVVCEKDYDRAVADYEVALRTVFDDDFRKNNIERSLERIRQRGL
jgi:hypothetical protein